MSKARITYRFDRSGRRPEKLYDPHSNVIPLSLEHHKVEQDDRIIDLQALNQFTTDFGAWSSPFDAETERVERIIREADRPKRTERVEANYHSQAERSEPDRSARDPWPQNSGPFYYEEEEHDAETGYYTEQEPFENLQETRWKHDYYKTTRHVRRTNHSSLSLIASVSGAVIVGLVFGFLVLSLFTNQGGGDDAETYDPSGQQPVIEDSGIADRTGLLGQTNESVIARDLASFTVAARSYFILQNGVFSTNDGAETAMADLKRKGFAYAGEDAGKYYIFAGLTNDRDDAALLENQLEQQGVEVYVKSYDLTEAWITRIPSSGEREVVSYFDQGSRLVRSISDVSVMHLHENDPSPLHDTTMNAIQSDHRVWMESEKAAAKHMPADVSVLMQSMNQAMHTAIVALEEYNRNPSAAHLWQAQSAVMNFVVSEKQLRASLSIES